VETRPAEKERRAKHQAPEHKRPARGADVIYYMHESFRDIVILPSILKIRREYMELIKRFSEPREPREAEEIAGTSDRLRELVLGGIVKLDDNKDIARRLVKTSRIAGRSLANVRKVDPLMR
jgi:CRISPR/Cas system-associated protein Csm6